MDVCSVSFESLDVEQSVTVAVWSAWSTAVDTRSWKLGTPLKSNLERSAFIEKQAPSDTLQ